MTEYQAKRNPNRCPAHPGALLREVLESVPMGKSAIADALGISRQHLHDVVSEKKPVSPKIAVRLGKLFGNGAEIWLRMQMTFDLWHAERDVDTSKIKMIA
jgi:antitoxin HigA-1